MRMKNFLKYCRRFTIMYSSIVGIGLFISSCSNKVKYNLSFENIDSLGYPAGWKFSQLNTGYLVRKDSNVSQDQNISTSIEHVFGINGVGACTYELASPLKGREIQLTGYIKTENVKDGFAGLWIRVEDADQNILSFNNMADKGIIGTQDWSKCSIKIPFTSVNADRIFFGGLLMGSGKLWIDNLQLTVDGRTIESLPLRKLEKADLDRYFVRGSGINKISLNKQLINNLTNLGMLWGFLKYYHSRVGSGDLNWDAELFRILPGIISCKSTIEANIIFEKWLDKLGPSRLSLNQNAINDSLVKMPANFGFLFSGNNLSQNIVTQLERLRDYHVPDEDNYYLSFDRGSNNPIFRHEISYSGNLYPDAGYRILALFRYWNIINYFYPYRYNVEGDWNRTLEEFIPKFLNAADKIDYAKVCTEIICRINDGHATVSGNSSLDSVMGNMTSPFEAGFIGNELVVTKISGLNVFDSSKLKLGDVIISIDGESVTSLTKNYLKLTPGSNRRYRMSKMAASTGWLFRSSSVQMTLAIKRDHAVNDVVLQRIPMREYYTKQFLYSEDQKKKKGYRLINGNIGYIYAGQLKEKDLDTIRDVFKPAKGVIVDLRCYPGTFMPYEYGKWLKKIASPFAIFTKSSLSRPGIYEYNMTVSNGLLDSSDIKDKFNFLNTYPGKLIILVNELSISQSEFTVMALQSIPGAIVLGSQTAGADGNVSKIVLPGHINTMISGIGVYYPDSTETQMKGIKINEIVKPTVEGIRSGKDEVLEHAVHEILLK